VVWSGHAGLVEPDGIAPSRKRLDLALDVLDSLRRDDLRFMLFIKSKPPWDYWWIWQREDQGSAPTRIRRIVG
jgi:hypothetical protein